MNKLYVLFFLILSGIFINIDAGPPADISFIIVDLKYNSNAGVKICEIQPAKESRFIGDYLYIDEASIADRFSDLLMNYHNRLWYILSDICETSVKKKFKNNGWFGGPFISTIIENDQFKSAAVLPVEDVSNILAYQGFLYAKPKHIGSLEKFHRQYPAILIIDEAISNFSTDKYTMSALFRDNKQLENLKPKWNLYPKKFSQELVNQITEDIPSNIYVIKPLAAYRGLGVIIVHKNELSQTLQYILTTKRHTLIKNPDKSYSYWASDGKQNFLVEEFIESDPVTVSHLDNHMYDGTMRVVAALIYNENSPDVEFLGEYWKLPRKSLAEEGSLIEKHRSYLEKPYYAKVDKAVSDQVKQQLREGLLILYQKMLGI